MRIIFIISFFFSFLTVNGQFGNRNLFFRSSQITPPSQGFNWNNLTTQAPTTYTNQSNIVIDGKSFTNTNCSNQNGDNLVFVNCTNVIVRNCYLGSSCGMGIQISGGSGFLIEDNFFANNRTGVYAQRENALPGSTVQDIIVQDNQCINPHGPFPRGQFVQFNTVTTSASGQCAVRRNAVENFLAESYAEDIINMFNSSGRAGAPIDVSDNLLRGGGPSLSGGGILLGESSGDWNFGNNNKVWNPGNYQMALGGGSNNSLTNNFGWTDNSVSVDNWSNVGYTIWAQQAYSLPFDNATFTGNTNYTYTARFGRNPFYYPTTVTGTIDATWVDPDSWYSLGQEAAYRAIIQFPTTIITYVTDDVLWQIRNESQQFRVEVQVGDKPPWLARPTANAGADQSISISTATLNGSGSSSTLGYNYYWVQVSGPNTAVMSAPQAVINNLSGLVPGVYQFRLVLKDNNGAGAADWMTITVS